MKPETKETLLSYLKSLEYFATTRGDGPFFDEDRQEAKDNMDEKRKKFEEALSKE